MVAEKGHPPAAQKSRAAMQKPRPLNSKSISPAACRCSACNWNIDKRLAHKLVWLRARDYKTSSRFS